MLPTSQPDANICKKATPVQASFPWCLITLNDIEIAEPRTALWSLSSCDFKGAERDAVLKAFPALFLGRKEREQPALIKSIFFFSKAVSTCKDLVQGALKSLLSVQKEGAEGNLGHWHCVRVAMAIPTERQLNRLSSQETQNCSSQAAKRRVQKYFHE